jgi:hypothetical protein
MRLCCHSSGRPIGVNVIALALLAACTQPSKPPDAVPAGEWRSFEGTLSATGDVRSLDAGAGAQATIADLSGTILLTGERGLGIGFQARAITFSESTGTSMGRAVWTDERGDRIFSELKGEPIATGRHVRGTITGGTGRWSGIVGEYGFDWKYVVEADARVQGRADDLRGRARIIAPAGGTR